MTIYIVIIFLAIINFLIQQRRSFNSLNFILFAFMMLVCALRARTIGVDTSNYIDIYSGSRQGAVDLEFAFNWIVETCRLFDFSPYGTQIVISVIGYSAFYFLFRKSSLNVALSILVYIIALNDYFFHSLTMVRQITATPFILLAFVFIQHRKYLKAAICASISIGFHMSSAMFIIFGLIAYFCSFSKKFVTISVIITALFAFTLSSISFLTNMLTQVFQFVNLGDMNKYEAYSSYALDLAHDKFHLLSLIAIPSFICIYAYKRLQGNYYVRVYFLGVVYLNLVSVFPVSYRMAYGVTALDLLIFPSLWAIAKTRSHRSLLVVIFTILTAFRLYILIRHGERISLIPYESYL